MSNWITRRITFKGKTQTIAEWASEIGISPHTVDTRVEAGWSLDKVFSPIKYQPGRPALNLAGERFGRLTVIARAGSHVQRGGRTQPLWRCRCDCGGEVAIKGASLRKGKTQSCGCLRSESAQVTHTTHGHNRPGKTTREYITWASMKARCADPTNPHYGRRGITVCKKWRDSFERFLKDMGPRPMGYSLDRINNNGNYEPANCRWANRKTQNRNKTNNRLVTHDGVMRTLPEWAEILGEPYNRIRERYRVTGRLIPTRGRNVR